MAKIKLSKGGFTPIPEGKHVFKITEAHYDEDFGRMELSLLTVDGRRHTERFNLIRDDGEVNEGALNAFSYFAKVAMNDFSLEEIDHEELEGRYLEAEVEHEEVPRRDDPSKTMTFIRLNKLNSADGFETTEKDDSATSGTVNLDELLG